MMCHWRAAVAAAVLVAAVPRGAQAQIDYRNLDDDRPTRIEDAYPVERYAFVPAVAGARANGFVETVFGRRTYVSGINDKNPAMRDAWIGGTPMARMGEVEEIASAVLFSLAVASYARQAADVARRYELLEARMAALGRPLDATAGPVITDFPIWLAESLRIGPGDRFQVFAYGRPLRFTVRGVIDPAEVAFDLGHGTLAEVEIVHADFTECHRLPR